MLQNTKAVTADAELLVFKRVQVAKRDEEGEGRKAEGKGKGKGKDRTTPGDLRSPTQPKAEGGADRGIKQAKMPEHEFQALREIRATEKNGKKACRFCNSSIGCSAPEGKCAFAHDLCILCGQNHTWCEHHQPSKSGGRR